MNDDIFKEYGAQKSIIQAIEELSLACMVNMQEGPIRIVFPKATLNFISLEAAKHDASNQSPCPVVKAFKTHAFPGGKIELVAE